MAEADSIKSSGGGSDTPGDNEPKTLSVGAPIPYASAHATAAVGSAVARYVVLEEIGRGGMGRVLRAYDPKLQREVALKEVRGEVLGPEGTARLVGEARAMAKLAHPNVVGVYDVLLAPERGERAVWETEVRADQVVLVMEYVAGQTLKAWGRGGDRGWRDVVGVYRDAGRGLAAAHEVGLLHRDFKPTNVLVSLAPEQSKRAVKVTDFGLAKATVQDSGSTTGTASQGSADDLTQTGTVLGTPRYMAPEQHRPGRAGPLSAAADQYAFCVALWEALCGAPPFSGGELAADKHKGPPPWPTATVPGPIAAAVTRGLAVDPSDRWPSMEALLEALAWDPARRRNRWLAGAVVVGVLALAGGTWESWAVARAARCTGAQDQLVGIWDDTRRDEVKNAVLGIGKSYATRAWERTQQELDAYARDWMAMHTEACEATTVRGEQSAAVMDLRMGCLHRAGVDLRAATTELADADTEVVKNAHKITGGLRPLQRCGDIEALQQEVEPPLPQDAEAVEEIREQLARSEAAQRAGRYAQAKQRVEAAKEMLTEVAYGPVRTEVSLIEGDVLDRLGEYEAAEVVLRQALEHASEWRQRAEMADVAGKLMYIVGYEQGQIKEALRYNALAAGLATGEPHLEAMWRTSLASIRYMQGKYEEAEAEHRRALAVRAKELGPDHPNVAIARNNVGNALEAQGKYEEAEAEHRRVLVVREKTLGPDHPDVALSRNNLGGVLAGQGKYEEAEAEYRRALGLWEKTLGPDHPDVAMSRHNLGGILHRQGKYAEAEAEYRRALGLWEKLLGPDHLDVALSRNNLGAVLRAQGKYEEAEAEHRRALAVRHRALGPDHPDVAASRNNLAVVLEAQGKYQEAEAEHRRALAVRQRALGPDHPEVALSRNNLGLVLEAQGKYEEAEAEHRRALSELENALDADHPHVALLRGNLAGVVLQCGGAKEAVALAEEALRRQQRDDIPLEQRAGTAFVLARALWAAGDSRHHRTRARMLAEDAIATYVEAGDPEAADEVRAWLNGYRVP